MIKKNVFSTIILFVLLSLQNLTFFLSHTYRKLTIKKICEVAAVALFMHIAALSNDTIIIIIDYIHTFAYKENVDIHILTCLIPI